MYNICIIISCEFLLQRLLRVMNVPGAFFLDLSEHITVLGAAHICEEVNIETIVWFLIIYFYVVLLEGRPDIRLEKKICREGKVRT